MVTATGPLPDKLRHMLPRDWLAARSRVDIPEFHVDTVVIPT